MRNDNRSVFLLAAFVLFGSLMASSPAEPPQPTPRRVTTDGLLKRDPVYSADGNKIVYALRHSSPRLVLMEQDLAKGKATRLYPQATLVEFRLTYAAKQRKHAFLRMTGNDQTSVMLFDAESKSLRPLKASKKVAWNPAISPDGRWVVYNLSGQLFRHNVKTGRETQLTNSSGRNDWPAVGPDSQRVAFCSSRDGDYEIYVCMIDGSSQKRLTSSRGLDVRPRWSPDGKTVVFTSNRDRNYEIYQIPSTGGQATRLTRNEERDDYAAWHPDGKRIVFVGERDGLFDLYELNVK